MMKKLLCWVLVIVLTICFAPTVLAVDTTPADGYNDHDYNLLQTFLNQPSATAGMTNGQSLNPIYDPNNPVTWTGVTWSTDAEKLVTNISFNSKGFAGTLDMSNCTALKGISCSNNELTSLDVSGGSEITYLYCGENTLTSLDISGLTNLEYLECNNNALTSLDVSNMSSLDFVYCFENELTSLNVSGCTALTQISCSDNALTELDVTGLTMLRMLSCSNNMLTSLDESTLTSLQNLTCRSNPLTSLDVSGLTSLTVLDCSDTGRTALDVSALTNLHYFYCSDNALTELDVSGLSGLDEFDCSNNALTELDVSNLIWLQEFDCSGNALTELDASLTQEERYDEASFNVSLSSSEDDPYINTVGNPLSQITVDIDGTIISLAATSGGYVEIDGDNYEFIAKPQALANFLNWTAEDSSEVATTEKIAFNYDTSYNLTANFEITVVPVGISCTKTNATTYGGSDGSITITASGGNSGSYEYSINGGASWQASEYFSGLTAATYAAVVRDAVNTSNVATQSVKVCQPATLSSSVPGGNIYIGGRITLTPNIDGGTWNWDHEYFTATFNSPATFTALKAGTSTITYTVDNASTTYDVTIEDSDLPSTGQDFTMIFILAGLAVIVLAGGVILKVRSRKQN